MSGFDNIIGRIRRGLNPGAKGEPVNPAAPHAHTVAPSALSTEQLRAQFIAALTSVDGVAIEAVDEAGAIDKIAELLRAANARCAAIGEGITTDSASAAERISRGGCRISRVGSAPEPATLKETLASADAGIVEIDYGIASTGTLVMVANAVRPRSLSLLPPINIALLRADRILPDLAAVLRTMGPRTAAEHPIVMVTGPSRTADIEKRIVVGVHGPRQLYVLIISQSGKASGSAVSA